MRKWRENEEMERDSFIHFLSFSLFPPSLSISYFIQDKVNYAVSEREDRVTGVTTLTRIAGCNGMYWAAAVLCRAVLGCTGM